MMPGWFFEMTWSDWNIVVFALLMIVFLIDYGFFSPWWTNPVGYIVMFHAFSVVLLMFLIAYGIVADQRVDEWARWPVTILLIIGIVGQIVILHYERRRGDREQSLLRSRRHHPIE